jgi:hypothetical protein
MIRLIFLMTVTCSQVWDYDSGIEKFLDQEPTVPTNLKFKAGDNLSSIWNVLNTIFCI